MHDRSVSDCGTKFNALWSTSLENSPNPRHPARRSVFGRLFCFYFYSVVIKSTEIQRFLRATKWDLPAAFSRTEETIVWRREFEVDLLNDDPSIVEEESRTGKEVVMGWDIQNRPCLYMFPGRQNVRQTFYYFPNPNKTHF